MTAMAASGHDDDDDDSNDNSVSRISRSPRKIVCTVWFEQITCQKELFQDHQEGPKIVKIYHQEDAHPQVAASGTSSAQQWR